MVYVQDKQRIEVSFESIHNVDKKVICKATIEKHCYSFSVYNVDRLN